ncbi:hypothetical protein J9303_02715 [Bacillaceae bacterium Marseille-Q3522]|nr:hypothetical protein [Bacillaceae bacterium Marseille-Q3522]
MLFLYIPATVQVNNETGYQPGYKVKLPSVGVFRRTGRTSADVATGRLSL